MNVAPTKVLRSVQKGDYCRSHGFLSMWLIFRTDMFISYHQILHAVIPHSGDTDPSHRLVSRRALCTTVGASVVGTLAGCLSRDNDDTTDDNVPGLPTDDSDSSSTGNDVYAPLGTEIATFETVEQWSTHGDVSIERDEEARETGSAARISGSPGSIEMSVSPTIDLSTRDVSVIARINQPQRTNLRLTFTDTQGETLSLVSGYYRDLHPTGWVTFTPSVGNAEADLTSIETILISIDGDDEAPLYWLDELRFPQRTTDTAQFAFTFDDNTRDIYETFYPIMREFDFPGSAAIITNQIDEANRLTLAEMDELAEAGWSIDNHTHDLSTLHGLSESEQRSKIETANEILRDHGFDPKSIMYPGGQCDRTTLKVATEIDQYGFLAFTSPYKGIAPSVAPQESPRYINRSRPSTFEEGKTMIDRAIEYGAAYPAYWHTAGSDGEITERDFREICNYLDDRRDEIEVVLPHEIG